MSASIVVKSYPVLEWGALHKGMTIEAASCATAMGVSATRWRDDRHLMLKLQRAIRGHRPDLAAHVTSKGDAIVILDDVGAEKHTYDEAQRGSRLILTNAARRTVIDCSVFTSDQKRAAEARTLAMGRAGIEASRALAGEKRLSSGEAAAPALPPAKDSPEPPKGGDGGT